MLIPVVVAKEMRVLFSTCRMRMLLPAALVLILGNADQLSDLRSLILALLAAYKADRLPAESVPQPKRSLNPRVKKH